MKEILLLLVLAVLGVCGYHLMGRVDYFLNTRAGKDKEESERDEEQHGK